MIEQHTSGRVGVRLSTGQMKLDGDFFFDDLNRGAGGI